VLKVNLEREYIGRFEIYVARTVGVRVRFAKQVVSSFQNFMIFLLTRIFADFDIYCGWQTENSPGNACLSVPTSGK